MSRSWVLDDHFDAAEVSDCMPDNPNVWSDGSCVTDDLAGISVAGSGFFSTESSMAWNVRTWGYLDDVALGEGGGEEGCRLFCSVPGPLQSVQKAELWGSYLSIASLYPGVCWC